MTPRILPTAAVLALIAAAAAAQDPRRPAHAAFTATTAPAPAADPADAVLDRLLDRPSTQTRPRRLDGDRHAGALDRTSGRGDLAVAPNTTPARLVREGTFVIDRVGRVVEDDAGRLIFVFAADGPAAAASAGDPPMVLVANLNLMALEDALRSDPGRRFRVTGRVTEYRGRNHLILEKVITLD